MTDPMNSPSSPETVRATRRGQLFSIAMLLAVLGFFALLQFVAMPYLKVTLSSPPPSNPMTVKVALVCFASIACAIGICTMMYGRVILRVGQYPLADAWVWRDTLVKRGRNAIKFGRLHIVIGALICLIGIGMTLTIWRLLEPPTHQFKILKNVIILPPKSESR